MKQSHYKTVARIIQELHLQTLLKFSQTSPKYTSEQEDPVQGSLEQQIFIEHLLLTIRLKMSIILRKTGIAGGILCKIKILSPYDSYLNLFLGNSTGL